MIVTKAQAKKLFGGAIVTSDKSGIVKSTEDYSKFKSNDWIKYFSDKAKEHDVKYQVVKYKDTSVIKSLMATYPSDEIKKIIDFLWDSDYRFKAGGREKTFMEYGIYLMSNAWLSSYYNLAIAYTGESLTPKRGWKEETENGGIEIDI